MTLLAKSRGDESRLLTLLRASFSAENRKSVRCGNSSGRINITPRLRGSFPDVRIKNGRIRGTTAARCMRGRIAGAILIGAVSAAAAHAADISSGLGVSDNLYSPLVARVEPVIVFNFEPGAIVRTYWYPLGEIVIIFRAQGSGQKLVVAKSCPSTACQSRKNIFALLMGSGVA